MKFYIEEFSENLSRKFNFHKKSDKNNVHFTSKCMPIRDNISLNST